MSLLFYARREGAFSFGLGRGSQPSSFDSVQPSLRDQGGSLDPFYFFFFVALALYEGSYYLVAQA